MAEGFHPCRISQNPKSKVLNPSFSPCSPANHPETSPFNMNPLAAIAARLHDAMLAGAAFAATLQDEAACPQ